MTNQLEETRHLEFDQLCRSVDDLAKRNKLGLAKTDELEDRIKTLERAKDEQASHINALHLSRKRFQGQVVDEGVDQKTVHQKLDYIINKLNYEHYG